MMKRLILLPLVFIFLFTGCDREDAWDIFKTRGAPAVEHVTLNAFNSITIHNGINVVLTQGDSHAATIEGWRNLMPKIRLSVDNDGMLTIEDANSFNFVRSRDNMTTVYLSFADELNTIIFSGNGDITTTDVIDISDLSIYGLKGSGSIDLKVNTHNINIHTNLGNTASITLSGQSNSVFVDNRGYNPVYLFDLLTLSAEIHQHGLGNTFVYASETLTVVLYSSGNVHYKGNPEVNLTLKGRGSLYKF